MKTERMRAWLLVYADDWQQAVGKISELFTEGEWNWVVVRADHVEPSDGFPYNLVIPIDAKDKPFLDETVAQIVEMSGAKHHAVALVKAHAPYPPQEAHCFLTHREAEGDQDWDGEGRYPKSPGRNPWG